MASSHSEWNMHLNMNAYKKELKTREQCSIFKKPLRAKLEGMINNKQWLTNKDLTTSVLSLLHSTIIFSEMHNICAWGPDYFSSSYTLVIKDKDSWKKSWKCFPCKPKYWSDPFTEDEKCAVWCHISDRIQWPAHGFQWWNG